VESIKQLTKSVFVHVIERLLTIPVSGGTRGWPFILSWAQRLSGVLLSLYLGFHVYTLLLLKSSEAYDSQMAVFSTFPFNLLAWLLAFPVIFHALNGGRVILYESFGKREDHILIKAVFILSAVYLINLGILMNLAVRITALLWFWVPILLASLFICFLVSLRLVESGIGFGWKLQRITGSFLLLLIPAHMMFMHSHPDMAHSASVVIQRMQSGTMKVIDILLASGILYHSGYGLVSILNDYLSNRFLRVCTNTLIWLIVVFTAFFALNLIVCFP
jgi:succinate dehydrogenase hydrophobic membrane anchor protein/succinate dehydrogenase cytochrome b556 subunit